MTMLYFVTQNTMFFTIPLIIVALGGLFSEKSGVVNIALEGIMIMGAFAGILFIHTMQNNGTMSGMPLLFLGLLVGMATGIVVSVFHAYASINLKANQVISGVAINMFAPAFAVYTARLVVNSQNIRFYNQFRIESVPLFGQIPVIGPMFFQNAYVTTLLGFVILGISSFVLFKTKFGLRLRACGEYPQAADSVGVSVTKMRYSGVLISGALAGLGGVVFIVPITTVFDGTVVGYGFLALAVLIFGAWKPKRILLAAIFFGLMQTIARSHSAIGFLNALPIPSHFYRMLPFIATLIVLAFTSKNTMAPKAAGQPYDKGGR
ncbi:MAG: ABC transporter permease [Firmicutes bacterium]|nr:ABC transporter permease [Bacillota bacterium]